MPCVPNSPFSPNPTPRYGMIETGSSNCERTLKRGARICVKRSSKPPTNSYPSPPTDPAKGTGYFVRNARPRTIRTIVSCLGALPRTSPVACGVHVAVAERALIHVHVHYCILYARPCNNKSCTVIIQGTLDNNYWFFPPRFLPV